MFLTKPTSLANNINLARGLFVLFGCVLAGLSVTKYYSLHSSGFDLGLFIWNISNVIHEKGRLFFGHSQPLMIVYSSIYNILPDTLGPPALLTLQAFTLALPILWIWPTFGALPTFAYILNFGVWYNALFDFHFDHLAIPILFVFFLSTERDRHYKAVFAGLFLLLIKEPFALQTAACGLYLLFIKRWVGSGIFLLVTGLVYFFFSVKFLIPYPNLGEPGGFSSSAFSWLGSNIIEMILFILSHPLQILSEIILNPGKRYYLFVVFGAIAFVGLLRPAPLIVALPIMSIALLSKTDNFSGVTFHYTAGLIAPLILSFSKGLPVAQSIWDKFKFPRNLLPILIMGGILFVHIRHSPSPISRIFWDKESWHYSYKTYMPTKRDEMIRDAIELYLPINKEVVVTAQNTVNLGKVAHRHNYLIFPLGVLKATELPDWSKLGFRHFWDFVQDASEHFAPRVNVLAEYVILDLKRPWFLMDQGCIWSDGKCKNNQEFEKKFLDLVEQSRKLFSTVFEEDAFIILKRR